MPRFCLPAPPAGARHRTLAALAALTLLAACAGGGDKTTGPDNGGGNTPPPVGAAAALTWSAGAGQTARLNSALATAPAIRVVDAGGAPVANVPVTFSVAAGGGRVATTTANSGTDGVAAAGAWTLGAAPGDNALTATVAAGAGGAPAQLTATLHATARAPRWTVMVYMAADNTLAVSGVHDIDEMEAAASDPEVQTVVQAEFSPSQFAQAGCGAACAHLPSFDTFRYQIAGGLPHVTGPDGQVATIGNRDMTDPAQLREFVAWAKAHAPAEHYALVLWNHGGGYVGLLEDDTSRPQHFMSLPELRTALAGGVLDVVDFDMCLMAGYETLAQLKDLAKVAVFSEQTEPGSGLPYTELLRGLAANSGMDARGVGGLFVQAWKSAYDGGKESTTQSAYDLAGLPAFEQALGAVAGTLRGSVDAHGPAVLAAAAGTQRYAYAWLKDVGDFAGRLAAGTGDAALQAQVHALRARATAPDFRIANYAGNGTADTTDVSRSTGLQLLLPHAELPASGPASFAAYQAQFGANPWTQFLAAYLTGAGTSATVDQGDRAFQTYLVWDSAAVSRHADVDLWILEPDGRVYVPWKGTVTPNGHLSDDSEDVGTFYEGYATNRYVQRGTYHVLASLYADPQDYRPRFDLVYRFGSGGDFTSVFEEDPAYPRLSKARSFYDDDEASWDKVRAGAYTDLQLAASFTAGGGNAAAAQVAARGAAVGRGGPLFSRVGGGPAASAVPTVTPAQLATLRRLAAERRAERRGAAPRAAVQGARPARGLEAALRNLMPAGTR